MLGPQNLVYPSNTPPPRKNDPQQGKTVANQWKILKIDTFLRGGAGRNLEDQRFYGHLGIARGKEVQGK